MKVLVVRFNSIGDLVLTTPTVKALHDSGHEVHFLVKKNYVSWVQLNPYIKKVWSFEKFNSDLLNQIRQENFDRIVDLHNNYRSFLLGAKVSLPISKLRKERLKDALMIHIGIFRNNKSHIVERFLEVASPLISTSKQYVPEFYFDKAKDYSTINLPAPSFIAIAVGTSFLTKNIPLDKLELLIEKVNFPIVLLGGKEDQTNADLLMQKFSEKSLKNLTGQLSIDESGYVISKSKLLISGDTGMMHIAAALSISTISIFGSTHPLLGYTPYYKSNQVPNFIIQNENLKCRPCTKQGRNNCPKGHFKCMNDISVDEIKSKIDEILNS